MQNKVDVPIHQVLDRTLQDAVLGALNRAFKGYLSQPGNLDSATNALLDDLIEDAILAVVFEVDAERKCTVLYEEEEGEGLNTFELNQLGDIFGHGVSKRSCDCTCPYCNRTIAVAVFAPHLAKCMGMGRNSSRIARTRIASNANKDSVIAASATVSDDEDDADWTAIAEKKKKKKKEQQNSKKLRTQGKISKNGCLQLRRFGCILIRVVSGSDYSAVNYFNMSDRERRVILTQICGVVSEHTKKVCGKSTKCTQHSDEQKKGVRDLYLTEAVVDPCLENLQVCLIYR